VTSQRTVLELADLHLGALYLCDRVGFITASRDPAATAPQCHLVRTQDGNRWLLRASLNSARRERLGSILAAQSPLAACADARVCPPDLEGIRAAVAEPGRMVEEYRGPAFVFPDELPSANRAEVLADRRAAPTAGPFAWLRDAGGVAAPIAIVRAAKDEVVAVCYSARSTSSAAEAGVETAERHQGRGYGSLAVLAWAAAVRREGRVPLYSTAWENTGSRALARRIGLICYAEDFHIG
jgi:RimJ/RimL family protein N-acetyltransferase